MSANNQTTNITRNSTRAGGSQIPAAPYPAGSSSNSVETSDDNEMLDPALRAPPQVQQSPAAPTARVSNFRPGGQAEAIFLRLQAKEANPGAAAAPQEDDGGDGGEMNVGTVANVPVSGPAARAQSTRRSRSDVPNYKKDYVDAHKHAEDFHHRGKGYWARGLPPDDALPTIAVRGPRANVWKARASENYRNRGNGSTTRRRGGNAGQQYAGEIDDQEAE